MYIYLIRTKYSLIITNNNQYLLLTPRFIRLLGGKLYCLGTSKILYSISSDDRV